MKKLLIILLAFALSGCSSIENYTMVNAIIIGNDQCGFYVSDGYITVDSNIDNAYKELRSVTGREIFKGEDFLMIFNSDTENISEILFDVSRDFSTSPNISVFFTDSSTEKYLKENNVSPELIYSIYKTCESRVNNRLFSVVNSLKDVNKTAQIPQIAVDNNNLTISSIIKIEQNN